MPGPITTVAGVVMLAHPTGVAVDGAGNLYIADEWNDRVRKVAPGGTITTIAGGNGMPRFSGDGGPATSAQLNHPSRLALDSAGNLYIADLGNNRVRKVAPGGTIATIAGTGASGGSSGDGGPAQNAQLNSPAGVAVDIAGNLYIADLGNNRVRKVPKASLQP